MSKGIERSRSYYVVVRGVKPGIYNSFAMAHLYGIKQYANPLLEEFTCLVKAVEFMNTHDLDTAVTSKQLENYVVLRKEMEKKGTYRRLSASSGKPLKRKRDKMPSLAERARSCRVKRRAGAASTGKTTSSGAVGITVLVDSSSDESAVPVSRERTRATVPVSERTNQMPSLDAPSPTTPNPNEPTKSTTISRTARTTQAIDLDTATGYLDRGVLKNPMDTCHGSGSFPNNNPMWDIPTIGIPQERSIRRRRDPPTEHDPRVRPKKKKKKKKRKSASGGSIDLTSPPISPTASSDLMTDVIVL